MLKITDDNVLEGIVPPSDCEKNLGVKWLTGTPTGSFYIGDKDEERLKIKNFLNGKTKCKVDSKSFFIYLDEIDEIVKKFKHMFYGPLDVLLKNRAHFQQLEEKDRYIYISYTYPDRYLKTSKFDPNVREFKHSLAANITHVRFEKTDDGEYTVYVKLVENWREVIMAKAAKCNNESIVIILNDFIKEGLEKGQDKIDLARLFGIKYANLIINNNIDINTVYFNSNYKNDGLLEYIKNGMLLSKDIIWESKKGDDDTPVVDDITIDTPTYWICAANVKFFDHVGAFELNGMIDWAQDKHFTKAKIGDIVFLYSSRPEKKVKYKCVITKKDITKEEHIDDTEFWGDPSVNDRYNGLFIRFELIKESNDERLSLSNLMTKGLKGAPQGAYKLDDERLPLAHYIDDVFEGKNTIDESKRLKTGYNTILYGVPGAGKSWTIENEYCKDCGGKERLVFHPDYTYADFVGQILPKVDIETNEVTYKFIAGPFTKIVKEAYENPEKEFFLIIEEINRGNAPAIFGDVFQLLDRDSNGQSAYGITHADMARIIYGDENHEVRIPSNMSILATMNTSDQNVFTLDTAFQRRWHMRLIENVFKKQESSKVKKFAETKIMDTDVTWEIFCTKLNEIILNRNIGMTSAEDKRLGTHFITEGDLVYITNPVSMKDHIQNSRFAEKVIKYLWDDAFKFSRDEIFNPSNNSLEKVIRAFMNAQANERFNIFVENIKKDLLTILENSKKDSE